MCWKVFCILDWNQRVNVSQLTEIQGLTISPSNLKLINTFIHYYMRVLNRKYYQVNDTRSHKYQRNTKHKENIAQFGGKCNSKRQQSIPIQLSGHATNNRQS